jgi:hypothetical protein
MTGFKSKKDMAQDKLTQPEQDATMQSLKDLARLVCDEVGKAAFAQPEQEPTPQEQLDKANADQDKARAAWVKARADWVKASEYQDKARADWIKASADRDKAYADLRKANEAIRQVKNLMEQQK